MDRRRNFGRVVAALLVAPVLAGLGCQGLTGSDSDDWDRGGNAGRIRAVCTTGMVADVVAHVGGDHVEAVALMGAGVDPHLYKPSPSDMRKMQAADVIFYSGLHLEGKMGDILERMDRRKPTAALAEGVPRDRLIETTGGTVDPHLWFDVALWSETIEVARSVLETLDPEHADDYAANAVAYRAELEALDEEVRRRIAEIPEPQRVLVTAHDAFGYFGRAYGIEVRGIQGISTESEASVRQINELVDGLVSRRIKAVFVESSVSDRNVEALVEGCRARGHEIRIGGQLFSDAMGNPGAPEGTYVGMVRHNVKTIVQSLK